MINIFSHIFISFLLLILGAANVLADAPNFKRGFPTDIWINWPDNDKFVNDINIKTFPEYRQYLNVIHFKKMQDAGFDFVRLTIDPAIYLIKPSPEKTAQLNAGVITAIKDIRSIGLNVDVDLHAIPVDGRSVGTETYLKDDKAFASYLNFVSDVGKAIAEQDRNHVTFEPMNEPTIDCDGDNAAVKRWPAMALKMHDVARAAAPKLTLVISGACWGGADGLAVLKASDFKDSNILWSFHSYEPFYFTHQGANWATGAEQFFDGLMFPPNPKDKAKVLKATLAGIAASDKTKAEKAVLAAEAKSSLTEYYSPGWAVAQLNRPAIIVSKWQAANNMPSSRILMGEFGVMKKDLTHAVPESIRAGYLKSARELYESHDWAWSGWSWGGGMGLTDEDTERNPTPAIMKALGMKH